MNKKIIGFALIVVSLVSMGIWEFWGREQLYYDEILVLKESLSANTLVTEDSFTVKKAEMPSKDALRLKDKSKLLGLETSQFVPAGTELRSEYFSESKYQVGDETGKGIMSISLDWLLSYPQTLMRGDKVALYKESTKLGECVVAHARDSSNNEIIFSQNNRKNASGNVIYVEVIGDISTLVKISIEGKKGNKMALISLE